MGLGPLNILFTRVFRVALNKESLVKGCYVRIGNGVSWEAVFGGPSVNRIQESLSPCWVQRFFKLGCS